MRIFLLEQTDAALAALLGTHTDVNSLGEWHVGSLASVALSRLKVTSVDRSIWAVKTFKH